MRCRVENDKLRGEEGSSCEPGDDAEAGGDDAGAASKTPLVVVETAIVTLPDVGAVVADAAAVVIGVGVGNDKDDEDCGCMGMTSAASVSSKMAFIAAAMCGFTVCDC